MTGSGVSYKDLSGQTRAGINWSGIAALSGAGVNWTAVTQLSGTTSSTLSLVQNLEGTILNILKTVDDLEKILGGDGASKSLFSQLGEIQVVINKVSELSSSIEENSEEQYAKAEELTNILVDLANNTSQSFGMVGEEINKVTVNQEQGMSQVQDKLQEVTAYILAVKEAMDIRSIGEAEEEGSEPVAQAVVKSWLEASEG